MAAQPAILFVDDEENIRLTLSMMLESEGFKVTTAATVTEALRLMSEQKFDILISDMNIGRAGDGFTVVSAMRSTQPQAVRFILTGFPDVESALRALREEVDDYLIKPTEIEEIVQKIRSKLETREHRKEITQLPLSAVIEREREYITGKWLAFSKEDTDLRSAKLSDAERKDHVPKLLDVAVGILQGNKITPDDKRIARQHGETRRRQRYSANWLVREAKLLQDSVASCIQRNMLEIQISTLIPDLVRAFGIIQTLLEESLNSFLQEQETRNSTKH